MKNLVGEKFWRLLVIEETERRWKYRRMFKCECDCGKFIVTNMTNITSWHTKSCWCYDKELSADRRRTHWMTWTKIHNVWFGILRRCNNKNEISYKDYWGRGIKCEWDSFDEFHKDMWPAYQEWLTIERKNTNGNYNKENCVWATNKEQQNNRRNNHMIEYNWESKTVAQWAEKVWLHYSALYYRLDTWRPIEKALFTK